MKYLLHCYRLCQGLMAGKQLRWLLLFLPMLLPSITALGSHSMGADLTYQWLGGNTYQVTLTFYRDCNGIGAPVDPQVDIESNACGQYLYVICHARAGTGIDITPACSSSVTTCHGGAFTGVQEWVYDGTVTLPQQCRDWVFSYTNCCRNGAITTIQAASSNSFYVFAELNNYDVAGNNSPVFSNKPVPFVCLGQQYSFNHGAHDVDGDSLVYSLMTPLQGANVPVNYLNSYSATQPLNSSPAMAFDHSTGQISMTPQSIEVTVMAVLVHEYRNGFVVGSVERDMQVTVMNCNNNLPSLTGINGTNSFSMTVCANTPACFTINSNDPDAGQNLTVNWNNAITNATFNPTSTQHPVSTFCWTPSSANVGNSYTFTAQVRDDACPYYGIQIYSYTIHVRGLNVNAGPDQQVGCNGTATLSAAANGGSPPYTYLWNNGASSSSLTVGAGNYTVTVSDAQCTGIDTVNVALAASSTAAFSVSVATCYNAPVLFSNQSGAAVSSWHWNFGDGDTSNVTSPSHQYASAGTYNVTLIVATNAGCTDSITQSVTVTPAPTAAFTTSGGCVGTSVCFLNQTTGTAMQWSWDFGDNSSSSAQTPCHTFNSAGTYTIFLIAGNGAACSDTVAHTLVINRTPVVNVSATDVCLGNTTTLTSQPAAGDTIASYAWNFGNGNTSPLQTPTYNYASPGTYNIQLLATNQFGCTTTLNTITNVYALPNINAGPDQSLCNGTATTLNATGGFTYQWSPGNSTSQSISVNPNSTTSYIVSATDANGCVNSDTVQIAVNPLPAVSAGADQSICNGTITMLTATASTAASYTWYPANINTSSISVNPTINSNYWVVATDINGCSATDSITVVVNSVPVVSLNAAFICHGDSIILNAGNNGSSYAWSTGATTQAITVSDSGNYNVIVTNAAGCTATSGSYITVGNSPAVNPQTATVCSGQQAMLDAGNPGCSYLWSTGDTTQRIQASLGGNYIVTATNSSGCSAIFVDVVNVNPTPVVNFTINPVCFGTSSNFNNLSTIGSGTVSYNWTLGDGTTTSTFNPSHNYSTDGTFIVRLVATTSNGCTDSITQTAIVNPMPVGAFTSTDVCQNMPVSFLNTSSISGGSIASTTWNFADSTSSIATQPNHTYTGWGTYFVTLNVVSDKGCTSLYSQNVNIHPLPVAVFSDSDVCIGNSTPFVNQSTIANGSPLSSFWDFGNGDTSTRINPSYTFAATGAQHVTLTVTSINGCSASVTQTSNVYQRPTARVATNDDCFGRPAYIHDQSTSVDGPIASWEWTFGDGSLSADSVPIHIYNSTGSYNLHLSVTTSHGCGDQAQSGLNVFPVPTPQVAANNACLNSAVHVNDISPADTSSSLIYNWDFGDNTNSTLKTSDHHYLQEGNYNVQLSVTNQYGCVVIDSKNVEAYSTPVASFGGADACFNSPNNFTNSSVINSGNISTYTWSFGDGTTSFLGNPSHSYLTTGTFNVALTATSNHGCTSSFSQQVTVKPNPVIAFSGDGEGCTPLPAHFTDSSSLSNGTIVSWNWDFGDNGQSNQKNPTHVYTQGGAYPITLTVTASNGCETTLTQPNVVRAYPSSTADFTTEAVTADYFNSIIHFDNLSQNSNSYFWNFGDGTPESGDIDPVHTYMDTGKFTVQLIVTNNYGCNDTIYKVIDAGVKSTLYAPNSFTPNGDGNNDEFHPYYVQMKDIAVSIYDRWGTMIYSWQGLNGTWDGTYKGQLVSEGVYVYQINGLGNDNKKYEWTGSVTVMR